MKSDGDKTADLTIVIILLIATFLLKVGVVSNTWAISTDSQRFIHMSEDIKSGKLDDAIAKDYHLLLPLMTAGVSLFLGISSESAGTWIAVAFGALAVIPLYFLGKQIYGRVAGVFAALVWATHHYIMRETADLMSDGIEIFFILSALCVTVWALRTKRPALLLLCGAAAGLAYHTRPEGMAVAAAAAVYVLFSRKYEWRPRRKVVGVVCVFIAALAVAAPYIYKISNTPEGFELRITYKKSVMQLLGLKKAAPAPSTQNKPEENDETSGHQGGIPLPKQEKRSASAQILATVWVYLWVHGPFLGFTLIGLVVAALKRRSSRPGTALLAGTAVLFAVVVMLLAINIYNFDSPSKRHLMAAVAPTIPVCGAGMVFMLSWMAGLFGKRLSPRNSMLLALGLCTLALAGSAVVGLRPQRMEETTQKIMAERIREFNIDSPKIMSNFEKIAYYSGGVHAGFPDAESLDAFLESAEILNADFVAVSDEEIEEYPFLKPENVDPARLKFICRIAEDSVRERFNLDIDLHSEDRLTLYRIVKQ